MRSMLLAQIEETNAPFFRCAVVGAGQTRSGMKSTVTKNYERFKESARYCSGLRDFLTVADFLCGLVPKINHTNGYPIDSVCQIDIVISEILYCLRYGSFSSQDTFPFSSRYNDLLESDIVAHDGYENAREAFSNLEDVDLGELLERAQIDSFEWNLACAKFGALIHNIDNKLFVIRDYYHGSSNDQKPVIEAENSLKPTVERAINFQKELSKKAQDFRDVNSDERSYLISERDKLFSIVKTNDESSFEYKEAYARLWEIQGQCAPHVLTRQIIESAEKIIPVLEDLKYSIPSYYPYDFSQLYLSLREAYLI